MAEENKHPQAADDGVDLTLIRWFLSLTPAERLQTPEKYIESVSRTRELNACK
jgi:hypothetical protein